MPSVGMREVQVRLLVRAIPRFIQIGIPLPPLKLMGQSRRGVMGLSISFKGGKGIPI
jgi:hypothetical protein